MMLQKLSRFATAALVASLLAAPTAAQVQPAPFTFVSTPDFLNMDLGDLTQYDHQANGGVGASTGFNSFNGKYQTAVDKYLDAIKLENPSVVMVAGDLTLQRWVNDGDPAAPVGGGKGIFGPVYSGHRDFDVEEARNRAASKFYYDQWRERFDSRGLTVLAAVGDHEIGDDEQYDTPIGQQLVPVLRDEFSKSFVDPIQSRILSRPTAGQHTGTAYYTRQGNVAIVTVDVFNQRSNGTVKAEVVGEQLDWVNSTLDAINADPTIDHVIVQGHVPIDDSPTVPERFSSGLKLEGRQESPLWKTMESKGVDLYFAGEVHADSVRQNATNPLLQVVHGAAWGFEKIPTVGYLVGRVDGDIMDLTLKETTLNAKGTPLFQPGRVDAVLSDVTLGDTYTVTGTLRINKTSGQTVYENAAGLFASVRNAPAPARGLLFAESFTEKSYPVDLTGTSPETGGAWTGVFDEDIVNGSLTGPSDAALSGEGGRLTFAPGKANGGPGGRALAGIKSDTGAANSVAWASVLIDLENTSDSGGSFTGLEFWNGRANDNTNRSLRIGWLGDTYSVATDVTGGMGSVDLTEGDAHFIVLKFLFGTSGDTIEVYVDRSLEEIQAGMFDDTITGADLGFTQVGLADFNTGTIVGSLDEIRIGSELSFVANIPEPASLALLGLGGLMLLPRRGGRRSA